MARNGSGTMSLVVDFTTEAASPPIEIAKLDQVLEDIADEITNSLSADGQTLPTQNIPMNGKRLTGLGAATALTDAARVTEIIDQDYVFYVDSGSANTYVITPSPAISAYEEGQRFVFRATNANSGASTLNVNGLGAIAIQTPDGSALASGAIVSGGYYEVVYDANATPDRWVLMSPPSAIPLGMVSGVTASAGEINLLDGLTGTIWTSDNDGAASGLDADTLDGVQGSDYARLSQSNNFTGSNQIVVSSNNPAWQLTHSNANTDEGRWAVGRATTTQLNIGRTLTDAGTGVANAIVLTRSGTTITSMALAATAITLNGVDVTDYARLSQGNTYTSGNHVYNDNVQLRLGTGSDLSAYHDGTNTIVNNATGTLKLQANGSDALEVDSSGNFDFNDGTVTTSKASAREVGTLGVPLVSKTADHTVVAADAGTCLVCTSAADDITIQESGGLAQGMGVLIDNQTGGSIDIIQGSGSTLTLAGTSTTGSRTLANGGTAYVFKVSGSGYRVGGPGVA